jgi:hypothetical protein
MKKLLTLFMLIVTLSAFGQDSIVSQSNQIVQSVDSLSPLFLETASDIEIIIAPYLKGCLQTMSKGAEFMVEETPVVIQQYLLYNTVTSGFWAFLGFFTIIFTYPILKRLVTSSKPYENLSNYEENKQLGNRYLLIYKDSDMTPREVVLKMGTPVFIIVGILLFFINIFEFIKLVFMPKLYLVEQFMSMLK